jgi:hypothetical protein
MESQVVSNSFQASEEAAQKQVLILGGSSFMGLELLFQLAQADKVQTHFINRGKTYW